MATAKKLKISVSESSISLFGEKYFKHGKSWVVPFNFGGLNVEVDPANDNLASIISCIQDDKKEQKFDQIDHLRINNRMASLAYLQGAISKEAFDKAEDNEEYIQIQLELEGKTFPVRIYPEDADVLIGTYTKEGEVV